MSKTAFIFPGQGSQNVGMLTDLLAVSNVAQDTVNEASDALGFDIGAMIAEGPAEALNQTDNTQPALLTASVAMWRHYQELGGVKPDMLAGHSLGEYSALTCAGVITFSDAVKLVRARGQYMQAAVPAGTGAMAAVIGLADDKIVESCAEAAQGEIVSAVNFNSPGQVVIAGQIDAVKRAGEACKAAGAKKIMPLPVSVPSHCELMKPAAERLAADLQNITFNAPQISVINNVDVAIERDAAKIKDALTRQLFCPVRWTETIEKMAAEGVEQLAECGPGKVLTGLTKRINKSITGSVMNNPDAIAALVG